MSPQVWTEECATLNAKVIGYWITTAILAFSIGSGCLAKLAHQNRTLRRLMPGIT